jgi:hypothetical protein
MQEGIAGVLAIFAEFEHRDPEITRARGFALGQEGGRSFVSVA